MSAAFLEAMKIQAAATDRQGAALEKFAEKSAAQSSQKKRSVFTVNPESRLPKLEESDKDIKGYYDLMQLYVLVAAAKRATFSA